MGGQNQTESREDTQGRNGKNMEEIRSKRLGKSKLEMWTGSSEQDCCRTGDALIIMISSCMTGSRPYSSMFCNLKAKSTLKQQYCSDTIL